MIVNDEIWGEGDRYDWQPGSDQGLVRGTGRYVNAFRTHPAPGHAPKGPFSFAVIGDFGVGMKKSSPTKRQREVGEALAVVVVEHDVRFLLTTGDKRVCRNAPPRHSDWRSGR